MEPLFIIIVLATVLLVLLAFKLIRSLIKASLVAIFIIIMIGLVTGLVIVSDAKQFISEFKEKPTTYILVEDGQVITGFQATKFNLTTYTVVSDSDLENHLEEQIFEGKTIIVKRKIINTSFSDIDVDLLINTNDQALQAQGFAVGFANTIRSEGPLRISKHLRQGNIRIVPRTMIVRFISSTPSEFAKEIFSDVELPSLQKEESELNESI